MVPERNARNLQKMGENWEVSTDTKKKRIYFIYNKKC